MNTLHKFLRIVLPIFLLIGMNAIQAQQNAGMTTEQIEEDYVMEYGLGIGISTTGYSIVDDPTNTVQDSYTKALLPSMELRLAYKINPRFKISSGIGFGWKGSNPHESLPRDQSIELDGRYIDIPLMVHGRILDAFSLFGGVEYSNLLKLEVNKVPVTSFADTKHQFAYRFGAYTTINDLVELGISTSRGITSVYTINLVDEDGNLLSNTKFKNQDFRISIFIRQ